MWSCRSVPAADQTVFLQAWMSEEESGLEVVALSTAVKSDGEGRFRSNHVPPGSVALNPGAGARVLPQSLKANSYP